jgi:hypothetical protein
VHVSLLTIGIILYKEVAGDKLICYDNWILWNLHMKR